MSEKNYPYKVSVSIITYNQEEFIQKAVDSAIAQEVDFPYEIIIGDDYSTDGTREILLDYKQKYPDLIKLNLQDYHDEEGLAGRKNNITNIQSAQGKYIAFCDGDDYWISKDKLQKQADFMDSNPEYSFCFHDTLALNKIPHASYYWSDKRFELRKSTTFSSKDIIEKKVIISSSSVFYRMKYFKNLPDWFWNVYLADRFLHLIAAQEGPFKFMKDIKSTRVLNKGSVSNEYFSRRMFLKIKKNDTAIIKKIFGRNLGRPISYKAQFYFHSCIICFKKRNYFKSINLFTKSITNDWRIGSRIFRKLISKLRFRFLGMWGLLK